MNKVLFAIACGLFLWVSEMSYQDAVEQHKINCKSATYVADNNLKCGDENE